MNPRIRRPRGGLSERAINSVPLSALSPLFPRQADVLGWIAAGKRNEEIAKILAISKRTVEKHVERIFETLGVETRAAAAAWWHEQRLKIERARVRNGR
jgi:DNA-binding CsgD family transcriptional regulator